MSTNFPGSLDNGSSLPNPSTTSYEDTLSHAAQHANANDAVKAVEAKLGIGATTPTSGLILLGTGTGSSAWSQLTSAQLFALLADKTGTAGSAVFSNTPTLVTPKVDTINEATLNNGVTVGGVNLKSGSITTANSVPNAAIATGVLSSKLSNPYKFSAYAAGATNAASGVWTKIAFATEEFDTSNNYDTTNSRFTAPAAGYYQFTAGAEVTAGGTGEQYVLEFWKNTSTELKRGKGDRTGAAGTISLVASSPSIFLNTSEYVEVFLFNGTGGVKTITAGQPLTYFGGHLVSTT